MGNVGDTCNCFYVWTLKKISRPHVAGYLAYKDIGVSWYQETSLLLWGYRFSTGYSFEDLIPILILQPVMGDFNVIRT